MSYESDEDELQELLGGSKPKAKPRKRSLAKTIRKLKDLNKKLFGKGQVVSKRRGRRVSK